MKDSRRVLYPLIFLFVFINALVFLLTKLLVTYHFDRTVLLAANLVFFAAGFLSFLIQKKGLHHKNPHVFVRSVMTGMMVKMIACVIAVFAYVYFSGSGFSKRTVFVSLFLYLVYLAMEVFVMMKLNKNKNINA